MTCYLLFQVFVLIVSLGRLTAVAEKVLQNARIYTMDDARSWADAVAIDDDGVITAVGSQPDVIAAVSDSATVVDMGGRLVLPGFQDAHLHAVEAGLYAAICSIPAYTAVHDISSLLRNCPNGGLYGDQNWILGAGIDVSNLIEELFEDPNLEYPITILDRDFPNNPVLILDNLGHGALANTRALQIVGYTGLTGNPPGGILDRDPQTNALTGIVLENAQQPLRDAAFPPTTTNQETAYQSLLQALEKLSQYGVTSVSDAGGFWRQAQTESWARAQAEGRLTVRAGNALYIYPDVPIANQIGDLLSRFSNDPTQLLRFNQAKIYVDGILSLATAALYSPYDAALQLPPEDQYGFEYFGNAQTLNEVALLLSQNGFQLHFHVVGDRATGLALDAIQQAVPLADGRPHRLTHCYLIDPSDRGRFLTENVVADFQLAPSSVDLEYASFLSDYILGSTRVSQLLPATEMYAGGATLTISSDWDADPLSPLLKLKTVLNRPDGRSFPDVATVLPMMTRNPARLLQTNTGSIEVGKLADLIALDTNIFEVPSDTLDQVRVVMTMFQGQVIFDPTGIAGEVKGVFPVEPSPSTSGSFAHFEWVPMVLVILSSSTLLMGWFL